MYSTNYTYPPGQSKANAIQFSLPVSWQLESLYIRDIEPVKMQR